MGAWRHRGPTESCVLSKALLPTLRVVGQVERTWVAVRGGGGGLSLVSPPPDEKRCRAAVHCLAGTLFPVTMALAIVLACIPVPVEVERETYLAYDATGAPLGASARGTSDRGCVTEQTNN